MRNMTGLLRAGAFFVIAALLVACSSAATVTPSPHAEAGQPAVPTQVSPAQSTWTAKLSGAVNAAPLVSGELVIIASADGAVHAVRGQTGESAWVFAPASKVWDASVNADEERVCGGMSGGQVFCLNAHTGEQLWAVAVGQEAQSRLALTPQRVYVPTTFAGPGMTPNFGGRASLFALDAASGEIVWQAVTDNYILRRPAVSREVVVTGGAYQVEGQPAGTVATRIYALNASDGSVLWKYESNDGLVRWVDTDGKTVVFSAASETVYGLDINDGHLLWEFGPGYWMQFPLLHDGKIYFGSGDERFQSLDLSSGRLIWQQAIDLSSLNQVGKPILHDGLIWFNAVTGELYALEISSGTMMRHLATGHTSRVGGALWQDLYILGDPDGNLYAYKIK